MKFFQVKVYNGDEVVYHGVVRSSQNRTAITNVLTNKYKKDCTHAESREVIPKESMEVRDGQTYFRTTYEPAEDNAKDDVQSSFDQGAMAVTTIGGKLAPWSPFGVDADPRKFSKKEGENE